MEARFQEVIDKARERYAVPDGERVYPVVRLRDRALIGVYVGGMGWAWRLSERRRVVVVQGYPVSIS